ncbi:MAG: hypothetical protein M1823_005188 [Watsoniomyces obsoletus]|nr:MAG: hypothetical protein M1823_005188 [Watsoniomyces obsoletus]
MTENRTNIFSGGTEEYFSAPWILCMRFVACSRRRFVRKLQRFEWDVREMRISVYAAQSPAVHQWVPRCPHHEENTADDPTLALDEAPASPFLQDAYDASQLLEAVGGDDVLDVAGGQQNVATETLDTTTRAPHDDDGSLHWRDLGQLREGKPIADYAQFRKEVDSRLREMHAGRIAFSSLTRQWEVVSPEISVEDAARFELGEYLIEFDGLRLKQAELQLQPENPRIANRYLNHGPGLHWGIRRGDRWLVRGVRGKRCSRAHADSASRTMGADQPPARIQVLLGLIQGQHPCFKKMPVRFQGRPASEMTDVDLHHHRARIGRTSIELVAQVPPHLTLRQTVESAWSDTIDGVPALDFERDRRVSACLRFFEEELGVDGPTGESSDEGPTATPPVAVIPTHLRHDVKRRLELQEYLTNELDWADEIRFGDATPAAQRVVLFLRAVIAQPDLIILEDTITDLPQRIRNKCRQLLVEGTSSQRLLSTLPHGKARQETVSGDALMMPPVGPHQAILFVSWPTSDLPPNVRDSLTLHTYPNMPPSFSTRGHDKYFPEDVKPEPEPKPRRRPGQSKPNSESEITSINPPPMGQDAVLQHAAE